MSPAWEWATSLSAILAAARRAAKGTRSPAARRFQMDAEREALRLQEQLRQAPGAPGAWAPSAGKEFPIFDPKPRTITVVPFTDRVAQHVIVAAALSDTERFAIRHSYACRVGRGQHAAVRRAARLMRRHAWVLQMDVASFFASVPHDRLLQLVQARVQVPEAAAWLAEVVRSRGGDRGLPIGALVSQHLANLYLGLLDHHITDDLGHGSWMRYMDDVLVFGTREALVQARARIGAFLEGQLGLAVNLRRQVLAPTRGGVSFLGWRVSAGGVRPTQRSLARLRARLRHLERARAWMSEEDVARRGAAALAWIGAFGPSATRRRVVAGVGWRRIPQPGSGRTPQPGAGGGLRPDEPGPVRWGPPGQPGRVVQRPPEERAGRQPRQGRSVQPRRQPRVPAREHGAIWPADRGPWIPVPRPSADPAESPGLVRGAEALRSGGGLRVAVGPQGRR